MNVSYHVHQNGMGIEPVPFLDLKMFLGRSVLSIYHTYGGYSFINKITNIARENDQCSYEL